MCAFVRMATAQTASLEALRELRETSTTQKFIFEHAGLFSPQQISDASELGAGISAAGHYVSIWGRLIRLRWARARAVDFAAGLFVCGMCGNASFRRAARPAAAPAGGQRSYAPLDRELCLNSD